MNKRLLGATVLPWLASAALAQSVSLAGTMGEKALLVIDGRLQVLAVGQRAGGVQLLSLVNGVAVVDSDGGSRRLRVGDAPARLAGGPAPAAAREIVIPASTGGHFVTSGSIDGHAVRFMVDTGATLVAIGQADAERLGLDYRDGQRLQSQTANGMVVVHAVTLRSLRVGEVELHDVPAVVVPAAMPLVLLGNSFLGRFQLQRDNDVMRLQLR